MSPNHPIALVHDDALFDEVHQLAAAAGCSLERVPHPTAARPRWVSAPLVILDPPAARACVDSALPRRVDIFVVCRGEPPEEAWVNAVAIGAERVIWLPQGQSWLYDSLAGAAERPARTNGKVLAVVGGRGGAGASVFAVSVGLTVQRSGASALLIDCDPLGGGLDLVHAARPGSANSTVRLTVLSGPRAGIALEPDAVAAVLEAGRCAGETVICDLPRSIEGGARAALERADLSVVVVPAEVRACAAAKLVARKMMDAGSDPWLLVRGPAPGGLLAEEIASSIGIPLLTAMRPEPNLSRLLDRGEFDPRPHSPLAKAARATLRVLASHPGAP